MKYKSATFGSLEVLRVVPDGMGHAFEIAARQAAAKAAAINHGDPGGRARGYDEIYSQNVLGAFADLACATLLQKYFAKHNIPLSVERYDNIRTDGFRERDDFDVRISSESASALVEVRSSVVGAENLSSY